MHLQSTEESNNKLNPRSTTTRPDLLLRLLVLWATAPLRPLRVRRLRKLSSDRLRKADLHALNATKSADGVNPYFVHNIYT